MKKLLCTALVCGILVGIFCMNISADKLDPNKEYSAPGATGNPNYADTTTPIPAERESENKYYYAFITDDGGCIYVPWREDGDYSDYSEYGIEFPAEDDNIWERTYGEDGRESCYRNIVTGETRTQAAALVTSSPDSDESHDAAESTTSPAPSNNTGRAKAARTHDPSAPVWIGSLALLGIAALAISSRKKSRVS